MVGMPSGRSPPFALGIITRRTGSGRYVFETSSARKPANHTSRPCSSMRANVIPSTPGAPALTRASRYAWSGGGEPIGVDQDVLATDLVVEQIEAEGGLRLGFAVELSLKAPDFIRRCQAHHQSPSPHHLQKRTRSRGPLLRRHYPASTLLLPLPPPAVPTA